MNDFELRIEYIPVKDLVPYANNARKHEKEDVDAIAASIQAFGFDDPVGIWSDDNVIVEGHGRVLAAEQLGMDVVPCIRLDHLTDEQRRAYALAHNRTAELSGWDGDIRDAELAGITEIDMSLFGFEVGLVEEVVSEKEKENNPTLNLPDSRVCVCTMSAFGTNDEVFLEVQLEREDAERILQRVKECTMDEVSDWFRRSLSDL